MKCRYCQDTGFVTFIEGEATGNSRKVRVRCTHPRRWSAKSAGQGA